MKQTIALKRFVLATVGSHGILMLLCSIALPGCATSGAMMWRRQPDHMVGAPCLKNTSDPNLEEVVEHLNRNNDLIQGWQANKVKIRVEGVSFSLSGMIAVEKDHRFRLMVGSVRGTEVDLGSNDQRFWVWARDMDPGFVTCKHENMDAARQQMGIPFEPEWLMQALGVSRLPVTGITMETDPEKEQARLIQPVITAHGLPLRRVVLVDLKRGIVIEHSLYNHEAFRIAQARLSDHRLDRASGVVLPHQVTLDWPQNGMSIALTLADVQINPASFPQDLWEMPEIKNTQVVHLDANLPQTTHSEVDQIPAAERWEPIQTVRSHDSHNFLRDQDLELVEEELKEEAERVDEADLEDFVPVTNARSQFGREVEPWEEDAFQTER